MRVTINGTRTDGVIIDAITFEDVGPDEVTISIGDQWVLVSREDLIRVLSVM